MRGWLLDFDTSPVLARALGGDAAYADLFAEATEGITTVRERGELVSLAHTSRRGLAVRTLDAAGQGRLASRARLDAEAALDAAEAVGGAGGGSWPEAQGMELFALTSEQPPAGVEHRWRVHLTALADRIARSTSPRIVEARVVLRDQTRTIAVARTDGWLRGATSARVVLSIEVIAQHEGRTETAHEALGGAGGFERLDEGAVEEAARLAAQRALRMLAARPAPAGVMPVILAGEAGGTFVHEAVGHPLEADLVLDDLSVFGERIGEVIASPLLTVVDDATLAGKNGSIALDDEGVPGERTTLIRAGVLETFLHDERSARLLGARSRGKGRRESFRHRPIVRMTNTLIVAGDDDPADIVRATPRGLYVTRMGGGEVDTVTGHFVFEAAEAFLIEGGAIGEPVRGATLTGDTTEVLRAIDRVGRDVGFGIGTCGKDGQDVPVADAEPTLRVPQLVVGGGA